MLDMRRLSRGRTRVSRGATVAALAATSVVLAACGVGSGSSGPSADEIAHFKKQGAEHVHKEERLRKLEKELKHIKKGHQGGNVPIRTEPNRSNPTPSPAPAPSPGVESCGGELEVNSYTTCPFAEAVEDAYYEEVGSGSGEVIAYSPVTETVYEMFCTSSPHECTGGNNAAVYFP